MEYCEGQIVPMNMEIELALLKQKSDDLHLQMQRFVSHLESEQRVYGATSKRVDQLETRAKRIEDIQDKHDSILRNGGNGLVVRVDRLEQRDKESGQNLYKWISIISLLSSLAMGIFTLLK